MFLPREGQHGETNRLVKDEAGAHRELRVGHFLGPSPSANSAG